MPGAVEHLVHRLLIAHQRGEWFTVEDIVGPPEKRLLAPGHGDGYVVNVAAAILGVGPGDDGLAGTGDHLCKLVDVGQFVVHITNSA